jgi:hypothetical protein
MSKISGELFLCCASSSRIIFSPFELSLYTYLQICGVPWFEPRLFFFGYRGHHAALANRLGIWSLQVWAYICHCLSYLSHYLYICCFFLIFLVRFFVAASARRLSSSAWYGATSGNYPLHFVYIILLISYNNSLKLGLWYLWLMWQREAEHMECCKIHTAPMRWWF